MLAGIRREWTGRGVLYCAHKSSSWLWSCRIVCLNSAAKKASCSSGSCPQRIWSKMVQKVLQGVQIRSDGALGFFNDPLCGLTVWFWVVAKPGSDAQSQKALKSGCVEAFEYLSQDPKPSQLFQVVKSLSPLVTWVCLDQEGSSVYTKVSNTGTPANEDWRVGVVVFCCHPQPTPYPAFTQIAINVGKKKMETPVMCCLISCGSLPHLWNMYVTT